MIHRERAMALARRQQVLLVRSAELRTRFADDALALAPPLRLADQARAGWNWLRARPAVPVALLVALAVLRPRRAWRLGLRLWWGWQAVRRLQRQLQAMR